MYVNVRLMKVGCSLQYFFSVDQATGVVTVARPLDREVAAIVRITVLVTDITAPSKQQATGKMSCIHHSTN